MPNSNGMLSFCLITPIVFKCLQPHKNVLMYDLSIQVGHVSNKPNIKYIHTIRIKNNKKSKYLKNSLKII